MRKGATPHELPLIARLRRALPADAVLWESEDLTPYECDGLSVYRQVPLAVVLPTNEDQVASVLRLCRDARVPVIARRGHRSVRGCNSTR